MEEREEYLSEKTEWRELCKEREREKESEKKLNRKIKKTKE